MMITCSWPLSILLCSLLLLRMSSSRMPRIAWMFTIGSSLITCSAGARGAAHERPRGTWPARGVVGERAASAPRQHASLFRAR